MTVEVGLRPPASGEPSGPRPDRVEVEPVRTLTALASRRRGAAPRGTHRMAALCRVLGSPQLVLPTVHVVGTDGKTSVARITSSLFEALGVRTGETTSPHLQDVRERIRIGGRPITTAALTAACELVHAALPAVDREIGQQVTFFEAVTATALRAFADAGVDVAVVEAGIGGTGDASNVVQGRVAVLTPIGLDHPELGATLPEVAVEKAGVVEPGGILVTAAQAPDAAHVVARMAAGRGATLLRAGRDFGVLTRRPAPAGQLVGLRGLHGTTVRATLPLRGAHQAANAALALAAVQAVLGTTDLDPARLRQGLASVQLPGRVELIRRAAAADVVLDGAHDVPAMEALVAALAERRGRGRCVVVLGVSGGRDPQPLVEALRAVTDTLVVTAAGCPTAMPAPEAAARVRAVAGDVLAAPDVGAALDAATRQTRPDDLIVVTGSLHLVGDARTALGGTPP